MAAPPWAHALLKYALPAAFVAAGTITGAVATYKGVQVKSATEREKARLEVEKAKLGVEAVAERMNSLIAHDEERMKEVAVLKGSIQSMNALLAVALRPERPTPARPRPASAAGGTAGHGSLGTGSGAHSASGGLAGPAAPPTPVAAPATAAGAPDAGAPPAPTPPPSAVVAASPRPSHRPRPEAQQSVADRFMDLARDPALKAEPAKAQERLPVSIEQLAERRRGAQKH
jgi:hypothetical protein